MPASEARIAAARANGARSQGPVSPEGKAISRANAYKHGMAGDGVVLPPEEAAEVARRAARMRQEMAPKTEFGAFLVDRMAELTVRVQRCAKAERVAVAHRADHAEEAFDEARLAEVDAAIARLAEEPATLTRKLRSMPEGVDRLIAELLGLRDDLDAGRWGVEHGEKLVHLTGDRWAEVPVTRARALSEAILGDFGHLVPGDGEGLVDADRVAWARRAMAERIDFEVEILLEHRETLDFEAIERDRAGAPERSKFDPSREATLARRYEAATEREVYRALKELRRVEAEAAASAPTPAPSDTPASKPAAASLGSFRARPVMPDVPPAPPVAAAPAPQFARVERTNEGPAMVGMGARGLT